MSDIARYYKILELEPGASPEEVKQGYKDLVLVWHPDRFPNNPRLQKKAQAKLQEINEARERLQAELKPTQTATSPKPPSEVASPPPTASKAQGFSNEKVKQNSTTGSKKSTEDHWQFAGNRQHDVCMWLD